MQRPQIRTVAVRRLLLPLALACFALTAVAADSGRHARPRALSRQGRPARLLGVLVRALPAFLSLAQRDAGQVRAIAASSSSASTSTESAPTPSASCATCPPSSRSSTTRTARSPPITTCPACRSPTSSGRTATRRRHIGFRNAARAEREAELQKLLETTCREQDLAPDPGPAAHSPAAPACSPGSATCWRGPEMSLDNAPLDAAIDDHIYFSKEASSGGRGFGGGGCGCN